MSSAENKAVFLSYASQDAAAAKRICEALRTAGVEVWFDQNELVGGDAWDQKIRKQIKECALLIPIVSQNTQARTEGYFRLEWRLADQRTHLMAKGRAFLLPVVIDDTKDAEAHVPDSFTEVQWTRLPGGETGAAFCARVKMLLNGADARLATRQEAVAIPAATSSMMERPHPVRRWLALGVIGLLVGAGAVAWNRYLSPAGKPAGAEFSEARGLVEKARGIFEEGDMANRETYTLAEALLKKAEELDVTEAEAWALHATLSRQLLFFGFDSSRARRDELRAQAERALRLAPQSDAAQLAYVGMQLALAENTVDAERILAALAGRKPDDWRVLRMQSALAARNGRDGEALGLLARARPLSQDHPGVVGDLLTILLNERRFAEAEPIIAQALARQSSGRVLEFDVRLKLAWRGDTAGAAAAMERWPAWMFGEDRGAQCAAVVWMWSRQPEKALTILERFPRDYIRHRRFHGPRAALMAWTHEQAGHPQAAQADWKTTLEVAERELAATPHSGDALHWKAWALARLGDGVGAALIFQELIERRDETFSANESTAGLVGLALALGKTDTAIEELQKRVEGKSRVELETWVTRANLELNPCFDPIRRDPRFQTLLATAEAPGPSKAGPAGVVPVADAKSVAVLPFANLSDDKDQEYFSDGLTEEILNALARERDLRVPGRSSSFSFKGKNVPAAEIARALNVSRLVEGSVRKSGNKVRISVSLTRASDGFSEELGTFTEELTDIFALQEKVARTVLEKLTRRTVTRAAVGLTKNTEAYDSYLRGRALQTRSPLFTPDAIQHYERAVALDPEFALAWARLAQARFRTFQSGNDHSPAVINGTREAIDRALAAQPDLPEALIMRANWVRSVQSDYPAARRDLERAEALHPATADLRFAQGQMERELGNYADAFRLFREALQLDPQNGDFTNAFAVTLCLQRGEFVEADQLIRRAMEIQGSASFGVFSNLIWVRNLWRGPEAALRLLDRAPASQAGRGQMRVNLLVRLGRLDEAREEVDRLEQQAGPAGSIASIGSGLDIVEPETLLALGREEAARRRAGEMVADATREFARGNRARSVREAFIGGEIVLGHRESALAALAEWRAEAQRLTSTYRRSTEFSSPAMALYARLGQVDEAVALLRDMQANGLRSHRGLRHDPDFAALRDDARFQELVRQLEAWTKTLPDPTDL